MGNTTEEWKQKIVGNGARSHNESCTRLNSVEDRTKTTINGVGYCASTIMPADSIKKEGEINAIRQAHKEKILKLVVEKSKGDGRTSIGIKQNYSRGEGSI